eukprot:Opistho-2@68142
MRCCGRNTCCRIRDIWKDARTLACQRLRHKLRDGSVWPPDSRAFSKGKVDDTGGVGVGILGLTDDGTDIDAPGSRLDPFKWTTLLLELRGFFDFRSSANGAEPETVDGLLKINTASRDRFVFPSTTLLQRQHGSRRPEDGAPRISVTNVKSWPATHAGWFNAMCFPSDDTGCEVVVSARPAQRLRNSSSVAVPVTNVRPQGRPSVETVAHRYGEELARLGSSVGLGAYRFGVLSIRHCHFTELVSARVHEVVDAGKEPSLDEIVAHVNLECRYAVTSGIGMQHYLAGNRNMLLTAVSQKMLMLSGCELLHSVCYGFQRCNMQQCL